MIFNSRIKSKLLKKNIVFVSSKINKTLSSLNFEEVELIKEASVKRQKEFSTGRWCARKAIKELGISDKVSLLKGDNGEPVWPEKITGSISHTKGFCCAVAADKRSYISIGVDVESASRKISDDVFKIIANEDEINNKLNDNNIYRLLIFSIKESFFKMLYPIVKKRFSFDTVSIFLKNKNKVNIVIKKDLGPGFKIGTKYTGTYFKNRNWLLTFTGLR